MWNVIFNDSKHSGTLERNAIGSSPNPFFCQVQKMWSGNETGRGIEERNDCMCPGRKKLMPKIIASRASIARGKSLIIACKGLATGIKPFDWQKVC